MPTAIKKVAPLAKGDYGRRMADGFEAKYLEEARRSFHEQKRLAEAAMAQLRDEELFHVPDRESNSVAVMVKHMSGNMRSRWTNFLTTDGEKPDRNRDQEFIIEPGTTRDQLMRRWEEGWRCAFAAVDSLQPGDLGRSVFVRGEELSVLEAINRQLVHYAQHVGQIVFLAKHLRAASWKSLSIPRGQSAAFHIRMREQHARRRDSR